MMYEGPPPGVGAVLPREGSQLRKLLDGEKVTRKLLDSLSALPTCSPSLNMFKKLLRTIAVAVAALLSTGGHAQVPPPVDLGIQNLPQETQVWCWAAVAQQIIMHRRGPAATPPQCALVAMANGAAPQFCCSGYNPTCVRVGSLEQIQYLIGQFGGSYSRIAPPTDPMTLYQTLASGRAIIVHVASGHASSHVVVLRGMAWVPTQWGLQPVLYINDPMSFFTQPVLYTSLVPIWINAIVVG